MHNLWRNENDQLRCDWRIRQAREQEGVVAVPLITQPIVLVSHQQLVRREPADCELARQVRRYYCIQLSTNFRELQTEWSQARNMVRIQDLWRDHLATIKSICSTEFWQIFLRLHTYSGVAIDTSLSAVKNVFLANGSAAWRQFPSTRRALLDKVRTRSSFWSQVWHTHRIDVRPFKLASGTQYVNFEFIDPLWAWIMAASKQNPWDLHWKPFAQDPVNSTYGGGVQYGKCFQEACKSCPPGSYPTRHLTLSQCMSSSLSQDTCPRCYIAPSDSVIMHVIVTVTSVIFTLSHSSCDQHLSTLSRPRCYIASSDSVTMHVVVAVTDVILTLSHSSY